MRCGAICYRYHSFLTVDVSGDELYRKAAVENWEMEMVKKSNATIYDVAARASVSPMTVTRALKYPSLLASDTLGRVNSVIDELDYSPNAAAQSLTTRKTRQIAFTLSSDTTLGLANSYYATEMAGVVDACAQHDYQCVVNVYNFSNLQEFVLPAEIKRRGIDGMIATGYASSGVLDQLGKTSTPIVFLGETKDHVDFPVVSADTIGVLTSNITYLAEKGHRRIGFSAESKKNEIFEIASVLGVDVIFFPAGEGKRDAFGSGCENAEFWLESPVLERPTAISGNDQWAMAFISTIQERGLKCPDDLSVISCDSILSQWSSPKMTSFGIDAYDAGFKTAELLIDFLESSYSNDDFVKRASEVEIPVKLIERASVGDLGR